MPGASFFKNKNVAARVGFSYGLTGDGKNVLKAFYGRYYNNLADGFSSANPGGTSYAEYAFNDLNHNGKYDGPQELGDVERLRKRVHLLVEALEIQQHAREDLRLRGVNEQRRVDAGLLARMPAQLLAAGVL